MCELHCDRSFTDGGRNPFHRSVAHISSHENSRDAGFEQEWLSLLTPAVSGLSVLTQIRSGEHEPLLIP
jgi:hypothetical protein